MLCFYFLRKDGGWMVVPVDKIASVYTAAGLDGTELWIDLASGSHELAPTQRAPTDLELAKDHALVAWSKVTGQVAAALRRSNLQP